MSIFGRGGIVDQRGRIVPGGPGATTLPLAYYAEGAWAIYSPPQPGNLFVAGSSYSILADQSGNERHALAIGTPGATDAVTYPGGTVYPLCGTARLQFRLSSPGTSITTLTYVHAAPLNVDFGSGDRLYTLQSDGGEFLSLRYNNTSNVLRLNMIGAAIQIGADIPFVANLAISPRAWWSALIRRENDGTENSTSTWRILVMVDEDDGAGPYVASEQSVSESVSMATGSAFNRSTEWLGVQTNDSPLTGVLAIYREIGLSDEDAEATMWAALRDIGADWRAARDVLAAS